MTREYPGTPGADTLIKAEIAKTTGGIEPMARCACGRPAMIVSPTKDIIRVACPCGFSGPNAPTVADAVREWNYKMQEIMIERAR